MIEDPFPELPKSAFAKLDTGDDLATRVSDAIQQRLNFTPAIELVEAESLPEYERLQQALRRAEAPAMTPQCLQRGGKHGLAHGCALARA